jgi:hypothetical protein
MRTLVGAVTVAGMLLLAGCGGSDPIPTLPPTPSATPIFASEEEALAAAEEAYAAYLEMSNLISSEGGEDPERIAPFVTERRLSDELRGFGTMRDADVRIEGSTAFHVIELQRYDELGNEVEVVFYACVDISDRRVIDRAGKDVTPPERADVLVLEVVLGSTGGALPLVLDSDDQWPGETC